MAPSALKVTGCVGAARENGERERNSSMERSKGNQVVLLDFYIIT